MSHQIDHTHKKNINSYRLEKGAKQEIRDKPLLRGRVAVRVATNNPISVQVAGPHTEQVEIRGGKEFYFDVEPEQEFYIGLQALSGVFSKPAEVTVEVEIKASKKAVDLLERVKNLTSMLRDNPDFYDIQKDIVRDTLAQIVDVWGHYGPQTRQSVNELISTSKKLDSKVPAQPVQNLAH